MPDGPPYNEGLLGDSNTGRPGIGPRAALDSGGHLQ